MVNEIQINNATIDTLDVKSKVDIELLEDFINYLDVKPITAKGYYTCIKRFWEYLSKYHINHPQREDILDYKDYLATSSHSAGTQRQYLRAIKQFFEWTDLNNIYPNIAKNIKPAKVKMDNTHKDSFTAEDIKTILDSIDTKEEIGARNYAMVLLCVTCGLRIIELQRANIEDLETIKGQLRLYIQGKGHDSKDDYKIVIPEVEKALNHYFKLRGKRQPISSTQPLFTQIGLNHIDYKSRVEKAKDKNIKTAKELSRLEQGALTEPSLSRILKRIFKRAGYDTKRLTAHSLRHTSTTLYIQSGASLYEAQMHARHSNPATTEIYIHDSEKEKSKSEQAIYNVIFTEHKQRMNKDLDKILDTLNKEELEELKERLYNV